jgi:short-subunit dehydrogenase
VVHVEPRDLADLDGTAAWLDGLEARTGPIDVLVNNAGGGGDFNLYDRADWSRVAPMLAVNIQAVALLTHRLLPPMIARRRGGVLNISSGFGLAFSPGFAGYIGSKHFVTGFTEALRLDVAGTGVTVTQVCPGPVRTEFAASTGDAVDAITPDFVYQSAEACARASLRGLERGRAIVYPSWVMKLLRIVLFFSPRFMQRLAQIPFARSMRKKQLVNKSSIDN